MRLARPRHPRRGLLRGIAQAVFAVAATAALAGCGEGGGGNPRDRISIDLEAPLACWLNGAYETEGTNGARTTGAGEAFEALLRLPQQSRLHFRVRPAVPAPDLSVEIASDARARAVVLASAETGAWQGDLSDFDGEIVRLRLENRSAGTLVWSGARVTGSPEILAPPLARPRTERPPNIVLYVVDTLRADRLSAYGYTRDTSPHIGELAGARGILFERAYAPGPSTLATLPALFTSRYTSMLPAQLREDGGPGWTFPELLHDAGYATGGFQANPWVNPILGFGRGFDHYFPVPGRQQGKRWRSATAETVENAALAWLDGDDPAPERTPQASAPAGARDPNAPFFLFVQTMDVHSPYAPPAPFRRKLGSENQPAEPALRRPGTKGLREIHGDGLLEALARLGVGDVGLYDAGVGYADHRFARFVAALAARGFAENTVVILTADHGESLGNFDDGTYLHGHSLHEELVHVPLVFLLPDAAPTRPTRPVTLLDVAPTILDLAGVEIPEDAAGHSLLAPRVAGCPRPVVGERVGNLHRERAMEAGPKPVTEWYVRDGRFKLSGGPAGRGLFDLVEDPHELTDLREERPIVTAYLRSIHHALVARGLAAGDTAEEADLPEPVREHVEEALRQLGYIE